MLFQNKLDELTTTRKKTGILVIELICNGRNRFYNHSTRQSQCVITITEESSSASLHPSVQATYRLPCTGVSQRKRSCPSLLD